MNTLLYDLRLLFLFFFVDFYIYARLLIGYGVYQNQLVFNAIMFDKETVLRNQSYLGIKVVLS